jgi:hypothetical protein
MDGAVFCNELIEPEYTIIILEGHNQANETSQLGKNATGGFGKFTLGRRVSVFLWDIDI